MPLSASPLSAQALQFSHGATPVLRDVSLLVPDGRLTVLLGPNGSGKSTLLSLLARLAKPSQGAVLLHGQDIHQQPTRAVARQIGLLPQTPLSPDGMTVAEVVARGRYPHQGLLKRWSAADDAAVAQALAVTGTSAFADRTLDQLSGGQRQRCFIALALAQETPILLFDEPTSYLDLRYQVEVMELIASLPRDHGRTVITVLHDLNFAMQYADRLVFLKQGRIHSVLEQVTACSAAQIEEVFETPVVRATHPQSGLPVFLPVSGGSR
ncbi:ABC transporter ATP-binding protein [Insolitispirillum peregrinum]|uniref:Iron complex transport system ATP-binding protein n=1 Tax=Insolitispirillum peregrinum TaxID=80876 RepID=A0A1N7NCZ3_9PROT|nr:ABC transporter ATP-binding protein [Insolitispirillum peregrinum]SIS96111.1 iron complex transport system ATP-binding protein [Insolitispirillum peregrinum]